MQDARGRERAPALISVCYDNAKGSLSEPRQHDLRLSILLSGETDGFIEYGSGLCEAGLNFLPEALTFKRCCVVGLSLDDAARPIAGGDPLVGFEKERLLQENAA